MGKFIDENGIAQVKIISPGQGTSAYYKEGQLRRDVAAFNGGLSFIDHPGKKEQRDRPERSLRDLVGPIVGTPAYLENGKKGPGMYGGVRVAKHWQPFIEELGDTLGISLRAGGSAIYEPVNGKQTKVAEKFNPGAGFDFVTQAGRGGKMVPLFEAAETEADGKIQDWMAHTDFTEMDSGRSEEERFLDYLENGQEDPMPDKEVQEQLVEAKGQVTTLTTERDALLKDNKQMAEAIALRDAQDKITEAVNDKKHEKLPDATKTRLIESLTKSAPIKEGKLDEDALKTLIEDAIKSETEYVESLTAKKPGVRGMGEDSGDEEEDEGHKRLMETKTQEYLRAGKPKEVAESMARIFCEGR